MIFQDITIYCEKKFKTSLINCTPLDKPMANYLLICFIWTLGVPGKDMKQE